METLQFEPMSVGRIYDRAFAIYRNHFLRFVTIVAIIEVPVALLSMASRQWINSHSWFRIGASARKPISIDRSTADRAPRSIGQPSSTDRPSLLPGCLGTVFISLLFQAAGMLCEAALTKSVSEVYLGNEITIGQAYRFILPKSVALLGAATCITLITWFGYIFLIVPGILLGLWLSLTIPAIVVENHSALHGLSRGKALVTGYLGKVFAVGLLGMALGYIAMWPLHSLGNFAGVALFGDNTALAALVRHFTGTLARILVTPINAAASILLYYDLRIRREGFDLQMLAQSMGSEQGPSGAC